MAARRKQRTKRAREGSAQRTDSPVRSSARRARPAASRRGQTYRTGRITREAIVRAAESVLIEDGHAQFTIQRVASRLGISPGNVNYYFPTKASLLETLIVYTLAQYRRRVRSAGEGLNTGTRAALGDVLRWLMEDATSARTVGLFRQLWALAVYDPRVAEAMDEFYSRSVRAHLRRLQERREHADVEAIVYLMHILSEGTIVLFGTRPGSRALFERVREAAHQAIMHLLTGKAGESGSDRSAHPPS